MSKTKSFEYLVYKLIKWHEEETGLETNDLSILKSLKLLFFVTAVKSDKKSNDSLLDTTFDNFVAMPYGHVESDIYREIRELPNISVNNTCSNIKGSFSTDDIENDVKEKIDYSIKELKKINHNLIKYSSFNLVDLSHQWYSWQYCFNEAKKNNTLSKKIPPQLIKEEEKIFSL